MTALSTASIARIGPLQMATGPAMSALTPGNWSRKYHQNEYDTLLAPIVPIAQASDSMTMDTASSSANVIMGTSAATVMMGIMPPNVPARAIVPTTAMVTASQRTTYTDRFIASFAAVYSSGEIGRLITKGRF